jgi:hypothetical protein
MFGKRRMKRRMNELEGRVSAVERSISDKVNRSEHGELRGHLKDVCGRNGHVYERAGGHHLFWRTHYRFVCRLCRSVLLVNEITDPELIAAVERTTSKETGLIVTARKPTKTKAGKTKK